MPTRPPSICATPGCAHTTDRGHCPDHQPRYVRSPIYNTKRWRALRRQVLTEEPWCRRNDCHQRAVDVDHIVALRHGGAPYDRTNLQALCRPHHAEKTALEIGLGHL